MSNLQNLRNNCYIIEQWLISKGIHPSTKVVSELTADFLKSKGLKYTKYNSKYKGFYTADICNITEVFKYLEEFKLFAIKKLKLDSVSKLEMFDFINWISDSDFKKCANNEWIKLGTGEYNIVANSTEELYKEFKKNK